MARRSMLKRMVDSFRPHRPDPPNILRVADLIDPNKIFGPNPRLAVRQPADPTRFQTNPDPLPKLDQKHVSTPGADMQVEPTRFTMPDWIDKTEWEKMNAQQRWNGSQALLAMMGHEGQGAAMAAFRGIPDKPPAWIKTTAKPDMQTALRLERHCAFVAARGIKDELKRREDNKLCVHRWAQTAVNSARVCEKCGYVQDLTKAAS